MKIKVESFDAEDFLQTKDIFNHPRIYDRTGKNSYEVAELMAEFVNHILNTKKKDIIILCE